MKFPAYWAKASIEEPDDDGQLVSFSSWGWSESSAADAFEQAQASARRNVNRLIHSEELERYPYGKYPLREEVIERLIDPQGELIAAVTQNSMGTLVLNTARAMFVDIDFPPESFAESGKSFLARLFKVEQISFEQRHEQAILDRIRNFHQEHRHWGMRIYRTAAGIRILVTHELFDPKASQTQSLLKEFGSDPLYIRLCQSQECFRARLTPKPWRCGFYPNPAPWPYNDEQERLEHSQWQTEYESHQADYATCRFVEKLGPGEIHPEVLTLLNLHDRFTRCEADLPLA